MNGPARRSTADVAPVAPVAASLRTVSREASGSRSNRLVDIGYGGWGGWWRTAITQAAYLAGAFDRRAQPSLHEVRRLVFVCLGNLNRSPFAAAVAARRGVITTSIGLQAAEGQSVSTRTVRCAAAFDTDLRPHTPTDISAHDPAEGDLLVVMEASHLHELLGRGHAAASVAMLGRWASPQRLHLEDPQGRSDDYLRSCFSMIHSGVDRLVDDLRVAGAPCFDPTDSDVAMPHNRSNTVSGL